MPVINVDYEIYDEQTDESLKVVQSADVPGLTEVYWSSDRARYLAVSDTMLPALIDVLQRRLVDTKRESK